MAYQLYFSKRAKKDFKQLDRVVQKRLQAKLMHFAELDTPLSVAKRLTNNADAMYRFRVGKFRILFDVEGDVIYIVHIDKRSDVYKMFLM